jgi:hypothetical protein
MRVGARGRTVNVTVAYSSLTFASPSNGSMTVSGPLMDEVAVNALAHNSTEAE